MFQRRVLSQRPEEWEKAECLMCDCSTTKFQGRVFSPVPGEREENVLIALLSVGKVVPRCGVSN